MVHPKGSWVPHKPFPSQKILGNLVGDRSLHKVMFFGPPFWAPKGPQASQGLPLGLGAPKWGLRSNISKLGNQKPCRIHWSMPQTEPYVASYDPKPFWGGGPNFGGVNAFPLGNHSAPGATPLPLGQPLCPCGNPFAPGATPLPLWQHLCHWGNPSAPVAIPLPLGQPLCPLGNPFPPGATTLPQGHAL